MPKSEPFTFEFKTNLPEKMKYMEKVVVGKAMGTTLGRMATAAQGAAMKATFGRRGAYNISAVKAKKHGRFKSHRKWKRMGAFTTVMLNMSGERIKLVHFDFGQKPRSEWVPGGSRIGPRKGAKVRVMKAGRGKGRSFARIPQGHPSYRAGRYGGPGEFAGFLAVGNSGNLHIFRRKNVPRHGSRKDRFPIIPMTSGAPTAFLLQEFGVAAINQKLDERFEKELAHQLSWYEAKKEWPLHE
jgi:hypothetical protein